MIYIARIHKAKERSMFSWLNLFDLQNCDLNDSMVSWLGVEKESLSTKCTYIQVSKPERNLTQNSDRQSLDLSYRSTK